MVSSELPVCCSQSGRAIPKEGDILGMSLARCRQLEPTSEADAQARAGKRSPLLPEHHTSSAAKKLRQNAMARADGAVAFSRRVLHLQEGILEPLHPVFFFASGGSGCPAAQPAPARRTSFPSFPSIKGLLLVLRTERALGDAQRLRRN